MLSYYKSCEIFKITYKKKLFWYLHKVVCFYKNKISKYVTVSDYHKGRGLQEKETRLALNTTGY